MKKALICGVTGQDGAYLAKLLLAKGYEVCGTSRDAQMSSLTNLARLGVRDDVLLKSMALNDFRSVVQVITKFAPDEIYNLAGQTSVGLSFEQPIEAFESIASGTLNLLEALRFTGGKSRLYNAGSSESFGDTGGAPASEESPFRPRSPYAVAKAASFWAVSNYREAYSMYACSGILLNHESPLRPERFVTQKIVVAAGRIARGEKKKLKLGNTAIIRDWGWAPEYVEAMHLMLQQAGPDDFLIATGESHKLEDFVDAVFATYGLDWREHVETDPAFFRPTDIAISRGDPSKAKARLGWEARSKMRDVARMMVEANRETHVEV
ncbi:MAG TPA: GDP-mannose 4,6-dehydratase [Chthoniobacteraceae bacterium]|nr:GDP-mannose 4,6-dehydratase [Chthoniobacteraceae bacterium]